MALPRACGILLHPTALPGPHGIGDIGEGAIAFLEALAQAGQSYWQVLPLGPTGHGDSPYAALSSFATNPLLISPDSLVEAGLLTSDDLTDTAHLLPSDASRVDFPTVAAWKWPLLRRAAQTIAGMRGPLRDEFDAFCEAEREWLEDYALFMALKDAHGGASWLEWGADLTRREAPVLATAREFLDQSLHVHRFTQFAFFRQWDALRQRARELNVRFIGDIPIFVATDSADVWANPHLFHLDDTGRPSVVAGVPPDYFSVTGQRWGNPLYRWDVHASEGYAWWTARIRAALRLVDVVRLDHFRGFQAYWEIPADEETAIHGRWVEGPGMSFFAAIRNQLGDVPFIAEDLGLITRDVETLRQQLGVPGMRVLQFAFGDDALNPYLPHNYESNTVVYTGTHDNDTTRGWFDSCDPAVREYVLTYVGGDGTDVVGDLVRLAYTSVADTAIIPIQDALGLDSSARFNVPGRLHGNWGWRLVDGQIRPETIDWLRRLAIASGRFVETRTAAPDQPTSTTTR